MRERGFNDSLEAEKRACMGKVLILIYIAQAFVGSRRSLARGLERSVRMLIWSV